MTPLEAMMLDAKQIALRAGTRMGNVPLSPRPDSVGNDALALYELIAANPNQPTSFYARLQGTSLATINKRITWLCSNHRRIERSGRPTNPLYSVAPRNSRTLDSKRNNTCT